MDDTPSSNIIDINLKSKKPNQNRIKANARQTKMNRDKLNKYGK